MLASAIGVTAWGMTRPGKPVDLCSPGALSNLISGITTVGQKAFHWIGAALLFTASTAYFSMASNLGAVPVAVEFVRYRGNLFVSATKQIQLNLLVLKTSARTDRHRN